MEKEDQDRFFEFEIGLFVRPTVSDHITAAESAGGKILKVGQYLAGVLRLVSAFSNHTVNTVRSVVSDALHRAAFERCEFVVPGCTLLYSV